MQLKRFLFLHGPLKNEINSNFYFLDYSATGNDFTGVSGLDLI